LKDLTKNPRPQEVKSIHSRLLRLGLAVRESQIFWRTRDPEQSTKLTIERAHQEGWFGAKSLKQVEYLVTSLDTRFTGAITDLRVWDPAEKADRCWVCHFHLQLTDPLYRQFTAHYLSHRLERAQPNIEKLSALRWLNQLAPNKWAVATAERLVSGLVSALNEAGFSRGRSSPRDIVIPPLSNESLAYLLFLLKNSEFEGSILSNPYLKTTYLGEDLERRLTELPGFDYQHNDEGGTLKWKVDSFLDWVGEFA
jgi:hypothetical protein